MRNPQVPLDVDVDRFTCHLEKGNWWWQRRQEGPALSEWLLMRAQARRGDRAVALRAYRRCAEVLKRELGEEPMSETRDLARRIRAGEGV